VRRTDAGDPARCPVWPLHQIYSDDATRAALIDEGKERGLRYESRIELGKPADCLFEFASGLGPDLVVIGSPIEDERGMIPKNGLGTVSRSVGPSFSCSSVN